MLPPLPSPPSQSFSPPPWPDEEASRVAAPDLPVPPREGRSLATAGRRGEARGGGRRDRDAGDGGGRGNPKARTTEEKGGAGARPGRRRRTRKQAKAGVGLPPPPPPSPLLAWMIMGLPVHTQWIWQEGREGRILGAERVAESSESSSYYSRD